MTSLAYAHDLSARYFDGELSPEFLHHLAKLPIARPDVRAFLDRACRLMVAGGFRARDLSEVQAELLGSLVARILPGAWEDRVPPITVGGRHHVIDRYLAANCWRPANGSGRLLDLGCGFPPVTTIDTAGSFAAWTVHGMDPSLPAYVLYDTDNNYATFDARRRIVYFQPAVPSAQNWTALLADPVATRARFTSLFADLAGRAPDQVARGETVAADGARLVSQPLREYERNGLTFSLGGIGSPVGGEYDVVRCFNVLMYFGDEFRTRALAWFTNIVREGGLLVTGSNWAQSTESRYFVFQRDGGRLRQREFAFSIDNLCPVAILPWYTTVDDDRELATLTPLLRLLRTNRAFKRQLDTTVDALREEYGICPRNGNGCYGRIDAAVSPTDAWAAAAKIADRMVASGLVETAISLLQQAGHRARANEVGHIAVLPPA